MKSPTKTWYTNRPGRNIRAIFLGLLDIVDGLITICSLGEYQSLLCMKYLVWETELAAKKNSRM